jgi:hypothetical protein
MHERKSEPTDEARRSGRPPYPGVPRWVKISGIVAVALVLLIAIIILTGIGGPHGPARHLPMGDANHGAPADTGLDIQER